MCVSGRVCVGVDGYDSMCDCVGICVTGWVCV